jgi:ubiquinone/menaquinone biosynthesis C-methylase UbiE
MTQKDNYIKAMQADKENSAAFYSKSFELKTEQVKMLEQLLKTNNSDFKHIADIACGSGSLSFHLSKIYPDAKFTLVDLNEDALLIGKQFINNPNFTFVSDSIYNLSKLAANSFDLVICWQTLSWLDEPEKAIQELLRITKPGGKIYASSLFNMNHDVDIYSKVIDHTKSSASDNLFYNYNTYSVSSITKWINDKAKNIHIHPFHPNIDFAFSGKGIGTYTIKTEEGLRLQFSAGLFLNWGILDITKHD